MPGNSIRTGCGRGWFYGLMHESHLMLKPGSAVTRQAPNHPYRKYKNMIKGIDRQQDQPIVGGRHHLYRHRRGRGLPASPDGRAFTHEIIGWVLSDSLVASNTVTALEMGISHVSPLGFDGLIHHSMTAAFNIVVINILIVYRPLKPRSA